MALRLRLCVCRRSVFLVAAAVQIFGGAIYCAFATDTGETEWLNGAAVIVKMKLLDNNNVLLSTDAELAILSIKISVFVFYRPFCPFYISPLVLSGLQHAKAGSTKADRADSSDWVYIIYIYIIVFWFTLQNDLFIS